LPLIIEYGEECEEFLALRSVEVHSVRAQASLRTSQRVLLCKKRMKNSG
jgi:hypothetical protein